MAAPLMPSTSQRAVGIWLVVCAALVFAIVVVGGVTRLTHSGLSIVEWKPLVGSIPPLTDADWQEQFAAYQQTPEFKLVNSDMDIEGFKGIFWWEYAHRLLGRIIGLVFLVPFAWFVVRRRLPAALAWKLGGIFALGGLQGALGWYMVKSGLVEDPRVSHFRLTAHLGLALAIFAAELWIAFGLLRGQPAARPVRGARYAAGLAALVFTMALSGGLVAGLRAGLAFNTFPLMDGYVVPPGLFALEPWWSNFLHNHTAVQFLHRLFAWLLLVLVPLSWLRVLRSPAGPRARLASHLVLAALLVQVSLGISTLVLRVPIVLAALHQAGAVLLLAAALWAAHALRFPDGAAERRTPLAAP